MSHILIIEDEAVIRSALGRLLSRNGYQVSEADSVEQARAALSGEDIDLVIADLRLPGAPGTDMIALAANTPVLIMTSYASVRSAVDAMKQGAADYIAKPFDHDEMLITIERILGQNRLERQNAALKSDVARTYPTMNIIGRSPAMQEMLGQVGKVAPTMSTVLLVGESGTGKELVARAIHEGSARNSAPMITLNCAAIAETLIENELFGHEKGSFTGAIGAQEGVIEAADGGTLFLDEIGELPLDAQARLLRALQEGEIRRVGAARTRRVDVRLIAATHRDLPTLVESGQFRDDLYFRIRVIEIRLPPLRDRGDDIGELAHALLHKSCDRLHKPKLQFSSAALAAIESYPWPGNVRELGHAIERAVILHDAGSGAITPALLALHASAPKRLPAEASEPPPSDLSLEEYFRHVVETHQAELTETELALRLGISRKALWERRQRLGIPRPKGK